MGKIWEKVPSPVPRMGKSLSISKVFTQILHLDSKSSVEAKKRLITASSPIEAAQRIARARMRTEAFENFCPFSDSLKTAL